MNCLYVIGVLNESHKLILNVKSLQYLNLKSLCVTLFERFMTKVPIRCYIRGIYSSSITVKTVSSFLKLIKKL